MIIKLYLVLFTSNDADKSVHHFACQLRSIDVMSIKKANKVSLIPRSILLYESIVDINIDTSKVSSIISTSISIFDITNPATQSCLKTYGGHPMPPWIREMPGDVWKPAARSHPAQNHLKPSVGRTDGTAPTKLFVAIQRCHEAVQLRYEVSLMCYTYNYNHAVTKSAFFYVISWVIGHLLGILCQSIILTNF